MSVLVKDIAIQLALIGLEHLLRSQTKRRIW